MSIHYVCVSTVLFWDIFIDTVRSLKAGFRRCIVEQCIVARTYMGVVASIR